MNPPLALAAVWLAWALVSAEAATYAFDGVIERSDPDDWGGQVTTDFIRIQVLSPGVITLQTTEDLALGLSFGFYSTHRSDGDLRFDYVDLASSEVDGKRQKQGSVAAGSYYIVLTASISEWDRENIHDTSYADGGPGYGYGAYHLDILGDFTVTSVYQGDLRGSVPEPAVAWPGGGRCVGGGGFAAAVVVSF